MEAGVRGTRDRTVEERLVLDHERVARDEADADDGLPETELRHARVQRGAAVGLELRRVVVRADVGGTGNRRSGEERCSENRCES